MSVAFSCPHCGQSAEVEEGRSGELGDCAACGQPLHGPEVQNRFAGSAAGDRFQFRTTIWSVLLCGGILLLLAALFLPPVRISREAARRNQCINNLKNIGLAAYNHHDVHKTLPLAASQPRSGRPGSVTANPAGYGWTVALLPFLEESQLYEQLAQASGQFQGAAFDPGHQPELSSVYIQIMQCPSDGQSEHVDIQASEYQQYIMPQGKLPPARSTYVALAASHFTNANDLGQLAGAAPNSPFDGNGVIVFSQVATDLKQGLDFDAITDGMSWTVMLAETREQAYAAWIDGQATWAIGAWQGGSAVPTETGTADGMLGWPDADQTSRTSLNVGPVGNSRDVYLSAARYGAGHNRHWGPSSNHTGGAINHLFADGHVTSVVSTTIDRDVYLRSISRGGGEAITLPD